MTPSILLPCYFRKNNIPLENYSLFEVNNNNYSAKGSKMYSKQVKGMVYWKTIHTEGKIAKRFSNPRKEGTPCDGKRK